MSGRDLLGFLSPYRGIPGPHYPFHDRTVVVTSCGRNCLYNKKINLSTSLAGQTVGVKEVDHGIWLVSFMDYDLGNIDLSRSRSFADIHSPSSVSAMTYQGGTFYVAERGTSHIGDTSKFSVDFDGRGPDMGDVSARRASGESIRSIAQDLGCSSHLVDQMRKGSRKRFASGARLHFGPNPGRCDVSQNCYPFSSRLLSRRLVVAAFL